MEVRARGLACGVRASIRVVRLTALTERASVRARAMWMWNIWVLRGLPAHRNTAAIINKQNENETHSADAPRSHYFVRWYGALSMHIGRVRRERFGWVYNTSSCQDPEP